MFPRPINALRRQNKFWKYNFYNFGQNRNYLLKMKIAFIRSERKIRTGAHYVNQLISEKLKKLKININTFYPRVSAECAPGRLAGIKKVMSFFSILDKKNEILKHDIIHGTTYTVLPFLNLSIPVVSYFGSTIRGFVRATPRANMIEVATREIWYQLRKAKAITELNIKNRQPMRDIAGVEEYVALNADAVIATSAQVRGELIEAGVSGDKIHLIHNAIEDYWFESPLKKINNDPKLVFLGRIGGDAFTLKLKGFDRLVDVYKHFSKVKKYTFCANTNASLIDWMKKNIKNHDLFVNIEKNKLPGFLNRLAGGILFVPSRYEGFSLSLVEGMSQGLVPVVYSVGVAPEIIKNGQNGYLVSSQSEAKEKIETLIADKELRRRLSKEAMRSAKDFSSGNIATKIIDLYGRIIDRPRFGCSLGKNLEFVHTNNIFSIGVGLER